MSGLHIDAQLSLPALVVIPELRITDKRLANEKNLTFLPLHAEPAQ